LGLSADPDQTGYIFNISGKDDPDRFDLVDGGVGGIEDPSGTVKSHFPREGGLKPRLEVRGSRR
jgi:hypothetical protein